MIQSLFSRSDNKKGHSTMPLSLNIITRGVFSKYAPGYNRSSWDKYCNCRNEVLPIILEQ